MPTTTKKRTYNRVRATVSTLKKSQARVPATWARRNSTQLGPFRERWGADPKIYGYDEIDEE